MRFPIPTARWVILGVAAALLVTLFLAVAQDGAEAPTRLQAGNVAAGVRLAWKPPEADAGSVTGYRILTRQPEFGEAFYALVDDTGSTGTSYVDASADDADTVYAYQVQALRGAAASAPSATAVAVTPPPVPADGELPADADSVYLGAEDLGDISDQDEPRFPAYALDGDADAVDYVRFTLTAPKKVSLGLRQLDADADLILEDADGSVLGESRKAGTDDERVGATLLAGAYYVRIESREVAANDFKLRYGVSAPDAGEVARLQVPVAEPSLPAVDADASRDGAIDLGDITHVTELRSPAYALDGDGDAVDYFTFTLTEPRFVAMSIRRLDADARIAVENEAGEVIRSRAEPGAGQVDTYGTLLEGRYYVRVEATEAGGNEYRLAHRTRDPNPERVAELRRASGKAAAAPTTKPPAAPTGLTGTVYRDAVALRWDASRDAAVTGYQVLRHDRDAHRPGEFAVLVDDTGSAAASWHDADVKAGARYEYRVKARSAAGLSPWSNPFKADLSSATQRAPASLRNAPRSSHRIVLSPDSLAIEEGDTATYTVALASLPSGTVTVTPASGRGDLYVYGADDPSADLELEFTTTDWSTPQTVHVRAEYDENLVSQTTTITHTLDGGGFDDAEAAGLPVTIADAGVRIVTARLHFDIRSPSAVPENTPYEVTEGERVQLCVAPVNREEADVVITHSGYDAADLIIGPASFTFAHEDSSTSSYPNYDFECFYVYAVPDADADDAELTVTFTGQGGAYDDSAAVVAAIEVEDLGAAPDRGVFVAPRELDAREGEPVTYYVALTSQPTGDVTVTPDPPLLWPTADPESVTFTTANWSVPQAVEVRSVDTGDLGNDGERTVPHAVSGADYGANDVTAPSVTVDVDDQAYSEVSLSLSDNVAAEGAGSVTVTVTSVWHSEFEPNRAHVFGLTHEAFFGRYRDGFANTRTMWDFLAEASGATDYTFRGRLVAFRPADYAGLDGDQAGFIARKSFEFRILDDDVYERNEDKAVVLDSSGGWSATLVREFTEDEEHLGGIRERLVIVDNDPSGITIMPTALEVSEEDPDGASYTLRMISEPAEDVYITNRRRRRQRPDPEAPPGHLHPGQLVGAPDGPRHRRRR